MSETVIVSFRIEDGIIVSVSEYTPDVSPRRPPPFGDRRDIEDAVSRVANTPVSGKINEPRAKEAP